MKSIAWTRYGPPEVLQVQETPRPVPNDKQILVKAAVVNVFAGDCELRRFQIAFPWALPVRLMCGIRQPRAGMILGQEFAGEVVEVGSAVTRFKVGDRVFGAQMFGCYAEYLVSNGDAVVTMPEHVSFEQAAAMPTGGLNALHFLRVAKLDVGPPGRKVLLNGAGGSIGTIAIQLARQFGAEVTAVDSTDKLEALRKLGADKVIDYTREDFTRNGQAYDAIIDIVGGCQYFRALKSIKPGGYLVLGNAPFAHMLLRWASAMFTSRRVRVALAAYKLADLEYLKQRLADGRIAPLIDRRFALDDVAQAHRYVESGRRVGNVVLTIARLGST